MNEPPCAGVTADVTNGQPCDADARKRRFDEQIPVVKGKRTIHVYMRTFRPPNQFPLKECAAFETEADAAMLCEFVRLSRSGTPLQICGDATAASTMSG